MWDGHFEPVFKNVKKNDFRNVINSDHLPPGILKPFGISSLEFHLSKHPNFEVQKNIMRCKFFTTKSSFYLFRTWLVITTHFTKIRLRINKWKEDQCLTLEILPRIGSIHRPSTNDKPRHLKQSTASQSLYSKRPKESKHDPRSSIRRERERDSASRGSL